MRRRRARGARRPPARARWDRAAARGAGRARRQHVFAPARGRRRLASATARPRRAAQAGATAASIARWRAAARLAREPRGAARRRRRRPPRPRAPSSARWCAGGRRPRAGTARGSPAARRRRSRRSSRRRARRPGRRGERLRELVAVEVLAQVVAGRAGRSRSAGQSRAPADVQHAEDRAVEAGERGLVDRARPQRAAEHEHQPPPRLDRERVRAPRRGRPSAARPAGP